MTRARPAPSFWVEALGADHRLDRFACSSATSGAYLRRQARNDLRTRTAAVFVLMREYRRVYGFYALTAHVVHLQNVWPEVARQLPRSPNLSTTLLQHLAVRSDCSPECKEFLLLDALHRAHSVALRTGSVAVVVNLGDRRDAGEEEFYLGYGFQELLQDRLWLPMKTVAQLFAGE